MPLDFFWHQMCPSSRSKGGGGAMSNRTVIGGVAAFAAVLMFLQLLAMFAMMSPATVMGGHMAGGYLSAMAASVLVGMLWLVFAVCVAMAVLVLFDRSANH